MFTVVSIISLIVILSTCIFTIYICKTTYFKPKKISNKQIEELIKNKNKELEELITQMCEIEKSDMFTELKINKNKSVIMKKEKNKKKSVNRELNKQIKSVKNLLDTYNTIAESRTDFNIKNK